MRPLGRSVTCAPRHGNGGYLAKQKVGRQFAWLCGGIKIDAELDRNVVEQQPGALAAGDLCSRADERSPARTAFAWATQLFCCARYEKHFDAAQ